MATEALTNETAGTLQLGDLGVRRLGFGEMRATPAQIAIAWLLKRSPSMLSIPGTASIDHLEENVAAASIDLTESEMAALNEAAG